MTEPIQIRPMRTRDWPEVRRIYASGIATGDATFEQEVPGWEGWNASHGKACRLVAEGESGIAGWAALSPVSKRKIYRGVAEVSIYMDPSFRGKGWGKRLLSEMVCLSEIKGFWTLQASIFPENVASIRIHERCGFRVVGCRERIGKMQGNWRDTILLERRSPLEFL